MRECSSILLLGATLACVRCFPAADVTMRPDGDVKTISSALEKVRALRASGAIPAGRIAEVSVESGRYPVTEAAVFAPADSDVRIAAVEAGRAVFDGGVALPPFKVGADGLWRARVPAGLVFEQLYVNGRRAQRARTPNEFYLYMREPCDCETNPLTGKAEDLSRKAFVAAAEDVAPLAALSPGELAQVEVLLWQSWDMGRSRVEFVGAKTGLVLLKSGTSRPLFHWSSTCPRYALENYRGALDAPGEWFLDVKAGELLYVPRPGERVESTRAVAPVAPGFVALVGDPLSGALVRNVTFEGLSFEHAAWRLPGDGVKNAQSAQNVRDAAILGDGVRGFSMVDCRISHVGMHGVWLKRGCRGCRMARCLVEDLGGGGVYLGDTVGWQQDGPERVTAFNVVSNCIVRTGGLALNGAIGVWIGHSPDNEIVHNDIGDFRYTGVSMGWTWGYAPTVAKRNRLMWNRIHHIGWGVLSDMGGVYTLGDSEGTVEAGNWIHDVNGYAGAGSPAWGLYTDEGSAGILLASNLVERCRDGAVHQHYGKDNTFANNIFATFCRNGVWRTRVEAHTTIVVTNNVFWWTDPEAHILSGGRGTPVKDVVFEGNVYWGASGVSTNAFSQRGLAEWRAAGHDLSSRFEDPLFLDPARGDWRLAPESPALKMGFVPWDWTDAGVLKDDAAWRADAMDDTRYPPLKDAPPAPRFLRVRGSIGFESFNAGTTGKKHLSFLQVHGARGVTVTDETAASGKRSLRLADSPEHGAPWEPHLIASIGAQEGDVRIRWSFRTDSVARPQFECRDYRQGGARPYAVGPSVTFAAGHVRAHGRAVADVPVDAWCRMEILLHVTGPEAGTWSCTATPAGGEPKTVDGLKVQAGFRNLDWNGFMTNGKDGVWYLDDFSVEPVEARK
ncbi:MAG: right-handed parallel beta-helix repeat-containing protein [Kiritimatiellae bacterium]|nr:right-handed parallel beta-helix repeat-containing protein [Kiritimatiellia bacterium]